MQQTSTLQYDDYDHIGLLCRRQNATTLQRIQINVVRIAKKEKPLIHVFKQVFLKRTKNRA